MGGVIAFEMAQQLQAEGSDVALLAIFDSDCPGQIGPWKRRQDLVLSKISHSPRLLQRNPTTRRWVIGEKIRQYTTRSNAQSPVEILNRSASRTYKPGSYNRKINYFWARDGLKRRSDTRLLWRGLAERGMEIHKIPGDHESILREPQLQVLAERLKECLDRALPS